AQAIETQIDSAQKLLLLPLFVGLVLAPPPPDDEREHGGSKEDDNPRNDFAQGFRFEHGRPSVEMPVERCERWSRRAGAWRQEDHRCGNLSRPRALHKNPSPYPRPMNNR